MIKRANNKKKKGFTLIELIIVLAVMAIIALIAIPNFAAVRENSKIKADKQSCETIERTVLMLVSDETVTVSEEVVVTVAVAEDGTVAASPDKEAKIEGEDKIEEALKEVKAPQGKVGTDKDDAKANAYKITIDTDGKVTATTTATTTPEAGK